MPAAHNETLGFLLADLYRLYRKRFEAELVRGGLELTPGSARALAYAVAYDGLRQKELADRMAVEPMTLVGYLDQLEALGLIERAADPKDRRCKLIRATAAAEPIMATIRAAGARVRAVVNAGMSDAEAEAFRRTVAAMRDRLAATPVPEADPVEDLLEALA
ncbi:MarR family transcriptional regulator [Stappia sp. F7233]|uniref:MarR family transcriptional regulator n=1 Tax=Stappia albiluteola TaxID=2758565 RepID=A0A839AFU0_9HYPH|nr:MarR family transcriptional regulator [Stappia albiluteola]MBA5778583.1 MarR family transcriptional regulator [Stappia albiluteola]